jgi:competence protein ComEC
MYALIKQVPFIRFVIPLIIGIILEYYFSIPEYVLYVALPLCIGLILSHHWLPLKLRYFTEIYYGIILTSLFIFLGAYILKVHQSNIPEIKGTKITRVAEVIQVPKVKENSYETVIKIKSQKSDSPGTNRKALIVAYFAKTDSVFPLKPGDHILFKSHIQKVKNTGNPFEFDYKRYLAVHGIHYQTFIRSDQYKKINLIKAPSLLAYSNKLRLYLLSQLKSAGLKGQNLAICSALTLGYKELLNKRTKGNFSDSGATHILAVSGLHVGIIFLLLHYLLLFMEKNKSGRITKTILIIIILGIYALITGLSPSVTRATLMFSILAIGKIAQRNTSIYNNLALSAFILLLLNPLILFSVGFQLSYAAVISIVFFQPKIYNMIILPLLPDKLWQWFSVAVAAQIGTAPLIIHYFNQFPNYFWLSNFIAIPAATIILTLGLLTLITMPAIPTISKIIGLVLNKITSTLNLSLDLIQNLPFSVSNNLYVGKEMIPLIYLMIILFTAFLLQRNAKALIIALATLALMISLNIKKNIENTRNGELMVLNVPNHSVYNYIHHKTNYIFTGKPRLKKETLEFSAKNIWLRKNAREPELINLNNNKQYKTKNLWIHKNFLFIGGKKILRLSSDKLNNYSVTKKLEVDYLIISQDAEVNMEKLCKLLKFKIVIIDSSNSYYFRKRLIKKLVKHDLPYYSVAEQGAFHVQIL